MSAANANVNVFPVTWFFEDRVDPDGSDASTPRLQDLFDAWVFAARDAELAFTVWVSSGRTERGDAHAVYRAALDREECAAAVLATATCRRTRPDARRQLRRRPR